MYMYICICIYVYVYIYMNLRTYGIATTQMQYPTCHLHERTRVLCTHKVTRTCIRLAQEFACTCI